MKASEAKQISELQSSKDHKFNQIIADIRKASENGNTSMSLFMESEEHFDKLRELGYEIMEDKTSLFSKWVKWDNPTV